MLLSVSRRTDIPALYADWFYQRIREGFVYVRNPMRYHSVARLNLSPEVMDGIAFWTKNPAPMMDRLSLLGAYPFYFHVTINGYGQDIEMAVPSKQKKTIPAFQALSDAIGPMRTIWRYDPILLTPRYTVQHHIACFAKMARQLAGYTEQCVVGFIDDYKNVRRHTQQMALEPVTTEAMHQIASAFAKIAKAEGITLKACSEEVNYSAYGIQPACCMDGALFERIAGYRLNTQKDRNQRKICRCVQSVDIGVYNTCANGCLYCYANYDEQKIPKQRALHDVHSPLLIGHLDEHDVLYERDLRSNVEAQTRFA